MAKAQGVEPDTGPRLACACTLNSQLPQTPPRTSYSNTYLSLSTHLPPGIPMPQELHVSAAHEFYPPGAPAALYPFTQSKSSTQLCPQTSLSIYPARDKNVLCIFMSYCHQCSGQAVFTVSLHLSVYANYMHICNICHYRICMNCHMKWHKTWQLRKLITAQFLYSQTNYKPQPLRRPYHTVWEFMPHL